MYLEWNLEVQQAIGSKSTVSLNYVGNRGYDEFIYNQLLNAYNIRKQTDLRVFRLPCPMPEFAALRAFPTVGFPTITA